MRADDLAPLLTQQPAAGVGLRQGTILAWDPLTAENTVDVGGAVVTNLAVLNTSEALLIQPGDVVNIITTGEGMQSWGILGRIIIPGTPQAASALTVLSRSIISNQIDAFETRNTGTYGDLATVGPTVSNFLVTNSGKCLVALTARIYAGFPGGTLQSSVAHMSFQLTGPTNISPDDARSLANYGSNVSPDISSIRATSFVYLDSLPPGTYSITAKYRATTNPGSLDTQFGLRNVTVIAL